MGRCIFFIIPIFKQLGTDYNIERITIFQDSVKSTRKRIIKLLSCKLIIT
jgi:hypothetical protein